MILERELEFEKQKETNSRKTNELHEETRKVISKNNIKINRKIDTDE